jgi:pimeloyl-ACP methyl ester carboxylesterase
VGRRRHLPWERKDAGEVKDDGPIPVVFADVAVDAIGTLEHGEGVIERLQKKGYTAVAPAVALRGVGLDSAYLASVIKQIDGPVLLVGHSYGGALITNAATDAPNAVGLVFVAAFAPDTDERLGDVAADSKDSVLMTALLQREYPTGRDGETAPEFLVDPARFRDAFAADMPEERTAVMAATQRPAAAAAFSDQSGPPAWKTLPSWAVVATADKAAGTDLVRSMAGRPGAGYPRGCERRAIRGRSPPARPRSPRSPVRSRP